MQYRWKSRSSEVKKFIIAFVNTLTKNYSRSLRPLAWIFPEVSQFFYFLGNTSAITWRTPASPWSLARRRLSFSPPGRGPSRTRLCQETVVVTALYSKLFIESLSQSKGLRNSEILKPLAHTEWLRKWNMAVFRKESVTVIFSQFKDDGTDNIYTNSLRRWRLFLVCFFVWVS